MQFGLFYEAPEEPGQTHAERYAEMLDLIAFGETLGFDAVWLAEIHFGGAFSLLSAPLMLIPVIARRTRHIRIGTAVTQVPLHHPSNTPIPRCASACIRRTASPTSAISACPCILGPRRPPCPNCGRVCNCIEPTCRLARDEFDLCQIICWFDQGCRLPKDIERLQKLRRKSRLTAAEAAELERLRHTVNQELLGGPIATQIEQLTALLEQSKSVSTT